MFSGIPSSRKLKRSHCYDIRPRYIQNESPAMLGKFITHASCKRSAPLLPCKKSRNSFFVCFGCCGIKKDLRSRDESSGLKEIPASNYSPALYCAVPSSWRFLTIVFGMGTCVTPSLWTPEKNVKEVRCLEKQTN